MPPISCNYDGRLLLVCKVRYWFQVELIEPNCADHGPVTSSVLHLSRHLYTQERYDTTYPAKTKPAFNLATTIKKRCRCSAMDVLRIFLSYFPVVNFVRKYRIKEYILGDLLSGLTVSFLHLPMAMGLGILASLRPIHGLYGTFFPVLVYMIFGTSPYISFGTNAVMALLTHTVVDREANAFVAQRAADNMSAPTADEIMNVKVGSSMACCVLVGCFLMGIGLLKLGVITTYLSASFVGGFTTAAAVHITASQVPKMFGIRVKSFEGAGHLVRMFIDLFSKLESTNAAEIVMSIICIVILLLVKIGINERYSAKMKIPVPIDLIIVIIGTIISHFANFHHKFDVHIVGEIPSGFTLPEVPKFDNAGSLVSDSFVMAVLSLALSISMARLCANKHGVSIDANQELIAYGACNFVSGFFHAFPSSTSPPRTMLLSTLGARTTLNAIPTCVFMLLGVLVIGQLFGSLPLSVLAAMIIVSMKDLLLQYRTLPRIWRTNKYDFLIWVVTNAVCILVDLKYGIIAGVGISIFLIIFRDQCVSSRVYKRAANEDILVIVSGKCETENILVFKVTFNLYFATVEHFKAQIFNRIFDPTCKVRNATLSIGEKYSDGTNALHTGIESSPEIKFNNVNEETCPVSQYNTVEKVVMDMSAVNYVDMGGLAALQQVTKAYQNRHITVYLAGVQNGVHETLAAGDFFKTFPSSHVYYDVFDALESMRIDSFNNSTHIT